MASLPRRFFPSWNFVLEQLSDARPTGISGRDRIAALARLILPAETSKALFPYKYHDSLSCLIGGSSVKKRGNVCLAKAIIGSSMAVAAFASFAANAALAADADGMSGVQEAQNQAAGGVVTVPGVSVNSEGTPFGYPVPSGATDVGYGATQASAGTKTDTPIIQIPQSIEVVTPQLLQDQGEPSMLNIFRNISGVVWLARFRARWRRLRRAASLTRTGTSTVFVLAALLVSLIAYSTLTNFRVSKS